MTAVHPRVCGERARNLQIADLALRFIPACAGNATASPALSAPMTVHPRVCGERYERGRGLVMPYGSSPRVRGTPIFLEYLGEYARFIPACAGNA